MYYINIIYIINMYYYVSFYYNKSSSEEIIINLFLSSVVECLASNIVVLSVSSV